MRHVFQPYVNPELNTACVQCGRPKEWIGHLTEDNQTTEPDTVICSLRNMQGLEIGRGTISTDWIVIAGRVDIVVTGNSEGINGSLRIILETEE